jgi:hypothetical protein
LNGLSAFRIVALASSAFKPGHRAPGILSTVVSCTRFEKHDYNIVNFKLPFTSDRARNSLRQQCRRST